MVVNIAGAVSVAVFYILILVSGIIAGRKTNRGTSNESILVADRSLSSWVSVLTITATGVGGAFINGCAEAAARSGLFHSQAIIGYSVCLIPAGLIYAPKMRRENYVTMFDPFQLKYGKKVGALLFLPQFFGDLFWSAATLSALGATISIILDIDSTLAIIVSAIVAIFYTFFGGLYAVAYTDVFQLLIMGIGMIIAFPFCLTHESVSLSNRSHSIMGEVPTSTIGSYIDVWLLCFGGGIPWQALYQRVLACKSPRVASVSTVLASLVMLVLSAPAVVIGLAGGAADFNQTSYDGEVPLPDERLAFILPISLSYLTPAPVAILGIGAMAAAVMSSADSCFLSSSTVIAKNIFQDVIRPNPYLSLSYLTPAPVAILGIGAMAAAVMSSADSCFLSSSTVIAKNIFQDVIRPNATPREIIWCLRLSIVVFGTLAAVVAVTVNTIYGLFVLCGDLMYVILLPQLTAVLWMEASNAYGCISGFFVAFLLRILCGEPILGLPAAMKLPFYDEEGGVQQFPYRSLVMVVGAVTLVVVSMVTNYLFVNEIIPRKYDFFKIYRQKTIHVRDGKNKKAAVGRELHGNNKRIYAVPGDVRKPIIDGESGDDEDQKL